MDKYVHKGSRPFHFSKIQAVLSKRHVYQILPIWVYINKKRIFHRFLRQAKSMLTNFFAKILTDFSQKFSRKKFKIRQRLTKLEQRIVEYGYLS